MDLTPKDFHVGQQVWFVNTLYRNAQPKYETVTKIGRKWVSMTGERRFDPESGCVDGGGFASVGRVYLHKEEWEDKQEAVKLWRALMNKTQYSFTPKSAEAVREAAKALGIDLPTAQGSE